MLQHGIAWIAMVQRALTRSSMRGKEKTGSACAKESNTGVSDRLRPRLTLHDKRGDMREKGRCLKESERFFAISQIFLR